MTTSTDYIKVNDDGDGVVIVENYEGEIKSFAYSGGYERKQARKHAEKSASSEAKTSNCDWGTNY